MPLAADDAGVEKLLKDSAENNPDQHDSRVCAAVLACRADEDALPVGALLTTIIFCPPAL